jgi:hypothetical protein
LGRLISLIPQPLKYRAIHRLQFKVILGPHKVQDAETVNVGLIRGRGDNTMNAALKEAIRQELESIGDIHRDAAVVRLNPLPVAIASADLQGGDGLAEEQGQAPKVGVPFDPNVVKLGIGGRITRVVLHVPEMTVRDGLLVPVTDGKIILGKLEDDGKQSQKLLNHIVVDVAGEVLDLRLIVLDDAWMGPLQCRDEFGNVVDLRIVENAIGNFLFCQLMWPRQQGEELTYTEAKWLVPIVAAVLQVGSILEFLLCRELKKRLPNGKLTVHRLLVKAKIHNVEESNGLKSFKELLGQRLFATRLVELGEIKSDQVGPFH